MSFFDSLGIAGAERIHTQMIFWLLTSCKTYSQSSKSAIVCALFDLHPQTFTKIECHTEYESIDLLVHADTFLGALENKLKSSQREGQLREYWQSLDAARAEYFSHVTLYKGTLLALTNEPPADTNWTAASYSDFHSMLAALPRREPLSADCVIVEEYIATLGKLTAAVRDFCTDHRTFRNVFTDGWKTKHRKSLDNAPLDDTQEYIRKTNIETILQKTFLRSVLVDLGIGSENAIIDESRGTAFFEIPLKEIIYRGRAFSIGFQLQGKTIKLNIGGRPYRESTPEWIDATLLESFKVLVNQAGYKRINVGPKRAYISGSQMLPGLFYDFSREDLVSLLACHLAQSREAVASWPPHNLVCASSGLRPCVSP